MNYKNIFVVADSDNAIIELSGVKSLGEKISTVVFGGEAEGQKALAYGADTAYVYTLDEGAMIEDYAGLIAELAKEKSADLVVLTGSGTGRLLAGKIGAYLGTAVTANVSEISDEGQTKKMVYGGAAYRSEKLIGDVAVVTLGSGVFESLEEGEPQGSMVKLDGKPESVIKRIESREKTETIVNLATAKCIVDVGRGLAAEEDLDMCQELAEVMGADVGCSRPVAEANGWMPVARYIGITGNIVKPDLILLLGVSGQVQHIVGIEQAKTVVAINKDPNALIFQNADFGLAGDMYKIVPKLIERLK